MNRDNNGNIESLLHETSELIEAQMHNFAHVSDPMLQEIIAYALKPKGYGERALLLRLACKAVGGDFRDVIPAAIAIELFHFSTLVIDDIFDESPLRGNYETVQSAYGYKNAIIVGEILNCLAFLALSKLVSHGIDEEKVLRAFRILKEAQEDVYHGQFLDLSFEHSGNVTVEQYIDMISKTTASLTECSLRIGAIFGGGNEEQTKSLAEYGRALGKGLQIRDDIVEIIGDPELIGKQIGADISRGKMRLPMIYALLKSQGQEARFLKELLAKRGIPSFEVRKAINILIKSNAIEYAKEMVHGYSQEAILRLAPLPESQAKRWLKSLAQVIATF